ncbi:hypothetical protein EV421DRAFT_911304 [Armillaria borealis]|uniref:F-box domain-containing protein n=1 Tax=Armillaria borealis TaxID=47425 RepID=A0AA39MZE8_9AGAR|nr:hypothetical protein EV421DRAFT_911304 [Armillaria borealis]
MTDAMFHLDAVARSVPEPVLPPDTLNFHISGILRATRPFLDTDHDWILPNIEVLQQQISMYDALLDRIDEIRSEMQSHRDVVHKSLVAYSSTLAPIRRLPTEILGAVFRSVQTSLSWKTERSGWDGPEALDFSRGPWKLSHVCGAWRDIVLSYPQLWSHIVLQYHWTDCPTETLHHTVPALEAMILRSAQHPLDITFDLQYINNEDAAIRAFSVILEESYRWRSIDLQIPLTLLEQLKVVRGKISCLESLTMKTSFIPSSSREGLPEEVRSAFIDAPRLQKVTLHHTNGFGAFMFPLHIARLAAFMDNVSNLEVYQSLVECHLLVDPPSGPNIVFTHHIDLPNLRRLFVSSPHLLSYLRLPSLDDLMICSFNASDMHSVVVVMNEFVRRSRCTLTSLAIHNPVAFHQVFIKDCLLLMDSLVSLEISLFWNVEANVIFDALASIGFLPNLQHLSLGVPFAPPSLWDPLAAMLGSRSQYLRSVKISCGRFDNVDGINEHLAPLWPSGLPVVVSMERNDDYDAMSCFGNFKCA